MNLKEHIRQHKNEFDSEEMSTKSEVLFKEKLQKELHSVKKTKVVYLRFIAVAASIVLVFSVILWNQEWVITLPDQRRLVGALGKVPVDTVIADVKLASGKPGDIALDEVVVDDFVPGLVPGQEFSGHFAPETLRVLDGTLVHGLILLGVDVCVFEIGGNRMDRKFRHVDPSLGK